MSVFSDMKKIWDALHPTISAVRGGKAFLYSLAVLTSPFWVVPAIIGLLVFGISSIKEFFSPSEKSLVPGHHLISNFSARPTVVNSPKKTSELNVEFIKKSKSKSIFAFFEPEPERVEEPPPLRRSRSASLLI